MQKPLQALILLGYKQQMSIGSGYSIKPAQKLCSGHIVAKLAGDPKPRVDHLASFPGSSQAFCSCVFSRAGSTCARMLLSTIFDSGR